MLGMYGAFSSLDQLNACLHEVFMGENSTSLNTIGSKDRFTCILDTLSHRLKPNNFYASRETLHFWNPFWGFVLPSYTSEVLLVGALWTQLGADARCRGPRPTPGVGKGRSDLSRGVETGRKAAGSSHCSCASCASCSLRLRFAGMA